MAIQFQFDRKRKKYCLSDSGRSLRQGNQFLQAIEVRGLSFMTVRAYGYDLVMLYRFLKAMRRGIKSLTQGDLLKFIEYQKKTNAAPKSINRRLTTARSFYRFCMGKDLPTSKGTVLVGGYYKGAGKEGCLGLNPRSRRRFIQLRVKVPQKLVEPLTIPQVQKFIDTLRRYRDLAIVYLMLFCGLRSREVLNLNLDDVQFAAQQLRILGKGNKERLLPLPDVLSETLERYLQLERPARCSTAHLFVVLQGGRKGKPMTIDGLRSLFRHRRLDSKIAMAHAHRFRHTFGADMARSGMRLPVLQKMMGHANAMTTLQYINLSMADIAEAYQSAIHEIKKRYASPTR